MGLILAGLPLLSLLLFILLGRQLLTTRQASTAWRPAILLAGVIWGLWLTFLTEGLSLFGRLDRSMLVGGWSLTIGGTLLVLAGYRSSSGAKKNEADKSKKRGTVSRPDSTFSSVSKIALGGVIFIGLITFVLAIFSAPNNWDSMTYHLSRVMHWTQNQTVAHYPTHEIRQLYQSPWAEFAVTHFYILSGGDRFVNMVQWLSMIGCLAGVSLIAAQLGASSEGQVIASLVAATIPMGVLQSVTTQTDYVVSFWLVCFVSFILAARKNMNLFYLLGIGGSLGLALLTKATAYLYAAPFVLWFGLFLLRTRPRSFWRPTLAIGLVVILLNSGPYVRNFQLFGSPLKPADLGRYDYVNHFWGPSVLISNTTRNIALHVTLPGPSLAAWLESGLQDWHQRLGLDPDDPRLTWVGTRFKIDPFRVHEDTSGNFIHLILFFVTAGLVFINRKQLREPLFSYLFLLGGAFFLFVSYLKWQPWHSRLHLPLFVLGGPVIGLVLATFFSRWLLTATLLLLLGQAFPFMAANPFHPLLQEQNIFNLDRTAQYFLPRPRLREPYVLTAHSIGQIDCRNVGLNFPADEWEYPFWILLNQTSDRSIRIEAIDVHNVSATLSDSAFEPCVIICLACRAEQAAAYTARLGEPILEFGSNVLFAR